MESVNLDTQFNNNNNNNNLTEQKYLELANDMKDIVEQKDRELIRVERILKKHKFVLYKVFGLLSFIDDIFDDVMEDNSYCHTFQHNLSYCVEQLKILLI